MDSAVKRRRGPAEESVDPFHLCRHVGNKSHSIAAVRAPEHPDRYVSLGGFDILLGPSRRSRFERFIPYTAFTDPQVAGVGLTEKEARERGVAFESAGMPFGDIARAVETDETAGQMKVLVDPKTERVLGAALVGAEAGELIHVFVALMQAGASARAIVDAEFVHPTFSEGVQSLVMKLERFSLR